MLFLQILVSRIFISTIVIYGNRSYLLYCAFDHFMPKSASEIGIILVPYTVYLHVN